MSPGVEPVYGDLPLGLVELHGEPLQLSPLHPGSAAIEAQSGLPGLTMLAPPGSVERRYAIAQGLRACAPGAPMTVLAPKDKGGARLRKELEAFGCVVEESARRHHRICHFARPAEPAGLEQAIVEGAPRRVQALGLWSQPGVFSWDRVDPGTALLLRHLPSLAGRGADLGCGVGVLARAVLGSAKVAKLVLVDIDRRAVDCARRNLDDARARFAWADVRTGQPPLSGLDFVVMNPPFHDAGHEDRALGQAFIQRAAAALRPGGALWLTANRHLPYEAVLLAAFARVEARADEGGYKVLEARK